ncbi:hypothetical protein EDD18DRAFT_1107288 [Armillaria luteobubalina]|uniref:Uncharacterized protein n=1 Tax=Armillaria luteobubalina TaxID=153913 RepID=A0AA39Q171_9AGAR|nr:hypothetical protein EDD18DRAFT_1107288 [Armillaria luteobubalina]
MLIRDPANFDDGDEDLMNEMVEEEQAVLNATSTQSQQSLSCYTHHQTLDPDRCHENIKGQPHPINLQSHDQPHLTEHWSHLVFSYISDYKLYKTTKQGEQISNTLGNSVDTAAEEQGVESDMINAQMRNRSATCASSSLTLTEVIQSEQEGTQSPTHSSGLPGAFNSTEERRQRVLEKSKSVPIECEWHTDNMTSSSTAEGHKPGNDESELIPIPEEANGDDELEIAEFKSNQASSPENDAILSKQSKPNSPSEHPYNLPGSLAHDENGHDDDNQSEHSSDHKFDSTILADDQLVYELAHDSVKLIRL